MLGNSEQAYGVIRLDSHVERIGKDVHRWGRGLPQNVFFFGRAEPNHRKSQSKSCVPTEFWKGNLSNTSQEL